VKVAMLQASLPPSRSAGGVGYQVHLLATVLARRGHDVTAFVSDEVPEAVAYHCVGVPGPRGRVMRVLGVGRRFARLDLSAFDVVHAHGDDWLFGRRPRVRTFYGSAFMEAVTETRWLRRGAQACYYALEWASSTNPHSVAISHRTRRYLPLVRRVVPCAYDPAVFFPRQERSVEPSILFVAGTMTGRKRGSLLLRSFEEVRRAVPNARLTIVSQDRVVQDGVTCMSHIDALTLADLYRSHWILCSTSSYEGFGVPYVEALASGLPVVTTPNHGAAEILQDGKLGVLADPDRLGGALITLISDVNRREELAAAGVEAAKPYSVNVVAAQYEAMYEEVATGSRSRSRSRRNAAGGVSSSNPA
jgi:phosphatidylinositol alpha-mannosyltransferase